MGSIVVLYLAGPGIKFRPGDILSRLRCSVAFLFPFKQIPGPPGIRRRLLPSTSSPLHYSVASCLLTLYSISNIIKLPHIDILYSKTLCYCPKFGAGLKVKLPPWDKSQVAEHAPISKNKNVTLHCLVMATNEYGAIVYWGLPEKNRRSSEQNCFSSFYPPPFSHNVTGYWTWGSIVIQIKCLCMHTIICGLCLPEIVTAVKTHIVLSSITPRDLPWR